MTYIGDNQGLACWSVASHPSYGGGGTTSSGGRSSSSLWRRSYGDVAILPAGGAGGASLRRSSKPPPRHGNGRGGTTDEHAADANFHVWMTDEHAAEANFHVSAVPGYVSFEDVIGGAALYRDGSGRPLEAAISDPLVRTASRLYAREDGRLHPRRQPSPDCGSPTHAIVKKYVHPLQDSLAGIFVCFIMPS